MVVSNRLSNPRGSRRRGASRTSLLLHGPMVVAATLMVVWLVALKGSDEGDPFGYIALSNFSLPSVPNNRVILLDNPHTEEEYAIALSNFTHNACRTQSVPRDPTNVLRELDTASAHDSAWDLLCNEQECNVMCGDTSIKTPVPPAGTLMSRSQVAAVWCTLHMESIRLRRPANLLVWGLGHDAPMWANATTGKVFFVEDDPHWGNLMNDKGFNVLMVKYNITLIERDLQKVGSFFFKPMLQGLDRKTYDVILVDAPQGCQPKHVGRFTAVYTSKYLVDDQGYGIIIVDDYNRDPERLLSDRVLECSWCGGKYEGQWWRVQPSTKTFVEKTAVFSFGKSQTSGLSTALQAVKY